ncbi:MAG TPA: hypothetical protein VFY42_01965, partial [Gemmatimonadales bacterium]|nr:hypothetical protein [Gemmatimonadales bacterium]
WAELAAVKPNDALIAAKALAAGGAVPGCAEDGLRAVFDAGEAPIGIRWGAFLTLQGLLAAEGRITELRVLVDSAVRGGLDVAPQLYLLDALAGVDVQKEAAAVAERLGRAYDERPFTLWLLAAWHAHRGDSARTEAIRGILASRAASTGDPQAARFAEVVSARLVLLDGDTTGAIERLRRAQSVARQEALVWEIGESLAPDRLLLAELLLARSRPAEALVAAQVFDHQAPAAFLPFLPASLELRRRAALALGSENEARRLRDRLDALGHGEDHVRGSSF